MADRRSGPRSAAFAFILVTVALDMLALGMVIPVLPKLVHGFTAGDTARAARVYGAFGTVWALMQFLCSPLQGALSDRFGRRPVVLLSNLGLGLDYVLMALAPNLEWLFVGRAISGITSASLSTAFAYIADVTPPEERAGSFGKVGAAFGIGFVLGPAVGGLLAGFSPRSPFWVAGGASLLNFLYGFFVLPESLPRDRRASFSFKRANPVGSLVLLRSNPRLFGLAAMTLLAGLAHVVLPSVFALYATHRYGWNEAMIGLTLAAVGVSSAVVQGGLVKPASRFGERRVLLFGLACGALGFSIYGLARTGPGFWCGIPAMALWGLSGPAAQGLMSRLVSPSEQGQLQGANSCLMGIAGLFGPSLFSQTFAASIAAGAGFAVPGAPFLLSASLLCAAFVVGALVTRQG